MIDKREPTRQALKNQGDYERIVAELTQLYTELLDKHADPDQPVLALIAPKEHYESLLPQGITLEMANEVRRADAIFQAALQRAVLNVSKDAIWKTDRLPKLSVLFKAELDRDLSGGRYDPHYSPPRATVATMRHVAEGAIVMSAAMNEECRDFNSGHWYTVSFIDQGETARRLSKTKFSGKPKG